MLSLSGESTSKGGGGKRELLQRSLSKGREDTDTTASTRCLCQYGNVYIKTSATQRCYTMLEHNVQLSKLPSKRKSSVALKDMELKCKIKDIRAMHALMTHMVTIP